MKINEMIKKFFGVLFVLTKSNRSDVCVCSCCGRNILIYSCCLLIFFQVVFHVFVNKEHCHTDSSSSDKRVCLAFIKSKIDARVHVRIVVLIDHSFIKSETKSTQWLFRSSKNNRSNPCASSIGSMYHLLFISIYHRPSYNYVCSLLH